MTARLVPPVSLLAEGAGYLVIFLLIGAGAALVAGGSVIRQIRDMSAAAAIARVLPGAVQMTAPVWRLIVCIAAVALASMRIFIWFDASQSPAVYSIEAPSASPIVLLIDLLTIPVFLAGCAGLLASWPRLFEAMFRLPARWITGSMHLAVMGALLAERRRSALLLFVTSLAAALAVMPRVTTDTFSDRVDRGVAIGVGGDVQIEYDLAELSAYKVPQTYRTFNEAAANSLDEIQASLAGNPQTQAVSMIQQYLLPDVFLPDQGGLPLDIIDDLTRYRKTVSYDERLGLDRPFTSALDDAARGAFLASRGFLLLREVDVGESLVVGYTSDGKPVSQQIAAALAYLPGQPSHQVQQREGFSGAEVDYLNYTFAGDSRAVMSRQSFIQSDLASLPIIPQSAVFVVRLSSELEVAQRHQWVAELPMPPRSVRWLSDERAKASRDMFVALAVQVMRVFMAGGVAIALIGIVAIGTANFLSYRRMLALVRIRGASTGMATRMAAGLFLLPVIGGVVLGAFLGVAAGYGVAHVIWTLPRIRGIPAVLVNQLQVSGGAWAILLTVGGMLMLAAAMFGIFGARALGTRGLRTD